MPTSVPNVTNGDTLLDTWGDAVRLAIEELQLAPPNHGSRHQPGGADALPTAAAGASAPGDTAATGVSTSLARADHRHSRLVEMATGRLWIPAHKFWPSTTNGCSALTKVEMATNKQNVQVLDFDQSIVEYAETGVVLPLWDGGTFTATVYAFWNSAFFNVRWLIQARSYGHQEALDQAWGTQQLALNQANGVTTNAVIQGTTPAITPTGTPAVGEFVQLRIARDATHVGDDLTADARFLGVRLDYSRGA